MPVHHVDMDPVRAGLLGCDDRLGEPAEVRGKYRRSEFQFKSS